MNKFKKKIIFVFGVLIITIGTVFAGSALRNTFIVGNDNDAISWGRYTNTQFGVSLEFPYANELRPYCIDDNGIFRLQNFKYFGNCSSGQIALGATYNSQSKIPGMQVNDSRDNTRSTVAIVSMRVEDSKRTSIEQFINSKSPEEPFSRYIIEKKITIQGHEVALVYFFAEDFDLRNPQPPKAEPYVGDTSIIFIFQGKLFNIHSTILSRQQLERLSESIQFIN